MIASTRKTQLRSESRQTVCKSLSEWSRYGKAIYCAFLLLLTYCGAAGVTTPAAADGGKVVARVNGEPIYSSDITRAIPKNMLDDSAVELRQGKLEGLIYQTSVRQFVTAHKIIVSDKEVDNAVAVLKKNPPSLGCACCRYASLDQFLRNNFLTMQELRGDIRNNLGMTKWVQQLWAKEYPTKQSQLALVAAQRKTTEAEYTRAWHIFFNTFQQPDQNGDPAKVSAQAKAKAEAAWNRLQTGESFASVAKSVSEDQMSKGSGGSLGFIQKTSYGKEFATTLTTLKPGEVGHPFANIFGWHIVKWEPIKDDDLLLISKLEYTQRKTGTLMDEITKGAKVVRYEK